jgi:LacI family transcriptional regulator
VVVDNASAARRATTALLALGHQRVALVIDETHWTTGRDRSMGYESAFAEAGVALDRSLIVTAGWDVHGARNEARKLLSRPDRPTAVFAANNVLAEGVWRAAAELQLAIPEQLSLIAFDDVPWMSMVRPGITAIAQDAAAMGEAALVQLIERIESPQAPTRTVMLSATLSERGSIGPPPVT